MSWEVNFIEDFVDYLNKCKLTEEDFHKIKAKLEYVSNSPFTLSEHVQGLNIPNLRRVRFGDFRIFIIVESIGETITALTIINRNHCYDKNSLNKVVTLVKGFVKNRS